MVSKEGETRPQTSASEVKNKTITRNYFKDSDACMVDCLFPSSRKNYQQCRRGLSTSGLLDEMKRRKQSEWEIVDLSPGGGLPRVGVCVCSGGNEADK